MEDIKKSVIDLGPVVFYDGDCGLCDWFIARLIRIDRRNRLRYATLQGETAVKTFGAPTGPSESWSVRLIDAAGLHDRSSAAIRAIAHAGGVWKAASVFLVVPKPIRDGVYRWVAMNRRRWFGAADTCQLPSPGLRQRFLP